MSEVRSQQSLRQLALDPGLLRYMRDELLRNGYVASGVLSIERLIALFTARGLTFANFAPFLAQSLQKPKQPEGVPAVHPIAKAGGPHVTHKHKAHLHSGAASKQQHETFLKSAADPAQTSEKETGVPASVTMAQAILESGWGRHHIGDANNYFGVKAFEKKGVIDYGSIATGYVDVETREVLHGKDVTIKAHFRKYASMTDSFRDHGKFLKKNKRYETILQAYAKDRDADAFATGLQTAGYATDPDYAKLLSSVMKSNNLYQYNQPASPK